MTSDFTLTQKSALEGSSTIFEEKATKNQWIREGKTHLFAAEGDVKKQGNSPLLETEPAKPQNNCDIRQSVLKLSELELEVEIEKARYEIFKHLLSLKIQINNYDKVMAKEVEMWIQEGLANISGEQNPQSEFFIKSLIHNFEEAIKNEGQHSKSGVIHTMDDTRKILVKLVKRIEQSFRPRPRTAVVKVARRDVKFVWIGKWILVALIIGVFPIIFHKFWTPLKNCISGLF